ncbi:MAG: transglycosylase domain-containing protein, partial [Patescibacteria group bacterium]
MPRRKRYTYAPKKKKSIITTMLVLFFGGLVAAGVGGSLMFMLLIRDLPNPFTISERKVAESTKIYDRTGKILLYEVHGEEKRTVAPFDRFSQDLKDATIVAEDFNFYEHGGIDIRSLLRAVYVDVLRGEKAQGG